MPNEMTPSEKEVRKEYPEAEVAIRDAGGFNIYSIQNAGKVISHGWWASRASAWSGALGEL